MAPQESNHEGGDCNYFWSNANHRFVRIVLRKRELGMAFGLSNSTPVLTNSKNYEVVSQLFVLDHQTLQSHVDKDVRDFLGRYGSALAKPKIGVIAHSKNALYHDWIDMPKITYRDPLL